MVGASSAGASQLWVPDTQNGEKTGLQTADRPRKHTASPRTQILRGAVL